MASKRDSEWRAGLWSGIAATWAGFALAWIDAKGRTSKEASDAR